MSRGRRAVFLDRDGIFNVRPPEHDYVRAPEGFEWLPGAAEAIARVGRERTLVVVSNQRGISRGLVSWETIRAIEAEIQSELRRHGAGVTAFYYCPHGLDDGCDCRKPAPGMLLRAASDLGLALEESVMVGDSESDVKAGTAAGCRTVLVAKGSPRSAADLVVPDVESAARAVLDGV